jgi:bifunctional non-homologous end joining protein LigD
LTAVPVGSHTLEVSNPDKVLFPDDGITKGDVVDYYRRIADVMVPNLRDRPLALHRFPEGIARGGFFQKDAPDYFPDWIERVTLERERGGTVDHVVYNDAASLVYLADQAVLVLHRLLVVAEAPRTPVELILDLDPAGDDPATVVLAARHLREVLDEFGLTAFVKSTGSKGLHAHVPLDGSDDFDTVRAVAHALASELAVRDPEHLTVEQRKANRKGRLFVDWLRNSYGQHAVAPFSLRALPGAPVAVPLEWAEATARDFDPRRYTLTNVFRRIARKRDPWANLRRTRQSLSRVASRRPSAADDERPRSVSASTTPSHGIRPERRGGPARQSWTSIKASSPSSSMTRRTGGVGDTRTRLRPTDSSRWCTRTKDRAPVESMKLSALTSSRKSPPCPSSTRATACSKPGPLATSSSPVTTRVGGALF